MLTELQNQSCHQQNARTNQEKTKKTVQQTPTLYIKPHQSNIPYLNSDYMVCTKYNKCMQDNSISNAKNINLDSSDLSMFEVPSQILQQQQPRTIQILPSNPYARDTHQTDVIVENNIRQKNTKARLQIKKQINQAKQIQQRLRKLKQITSLKLKNTPKTQTNFKQLPKWGHTIFGDDNSKSKQKKDKQSSNKQPKINPEKDQMILKPIEQRIQQYRREQKILQHRCKKQEQCNHKHSHSQKDISKVQKYIENNAKQVLKKIRQAKIKQQQNKTIIKGKIRAIQIQSRASLKRFKKKPIDPTIQFKVQIEVQNNQKKPKKGNNKQSDIKNQQILKAQAIKQNLQKLKNLQKYKNSKNLKQTGSSKKSKQSGESLSKQVKDDKIGSQFGQNEGGNKKFYFWDIPIYKQDYQKIQNQYYQQVLSQQKLKSKTFREQVDEYLNQKNHNEMQQNIRKTKQKRLDDLIQKKKQQYLSQFESQESQLRNMDQIFWNEDELYKFHPISNF